MQIIFQNESFIFISIGNNELLEVNSSPHVKFSLFGFKLYCGFLLHIELSNINLKFGGEKNMKLSSFETLLASTPKTPSINELVKISFTTLLLKEDML